MDNSIRKHEHCVVGLPRCDFVFSSTRSCFIAYGFEDSPLEMGIIRTILETRGLHAVEAGGQITPGQNAFCAKICSKIITAQFCVVLLNNEEADGVEIPNANINMEYGLMLGFNKYVIPFQRESQRLPFNVAGLDTVKYTNSSFEAKALSAIDQAIRETEQTSTALHDFDQSLHGYLLSRGALLTPMATDGDRNLYQLGSPLGFNLLNDFSGMQYMYFGNFSHLRPENIVRRIATLVRIVGSRFSSIDMRVEMGLVSSGQAVPLKKLLEKLQLWICVSSAEDRAEVESAISAQPMPYSLVIFSVEEVADYSV